MVCTYWCSQSFIPTLVYVYLLQIYCNIDLIVFHSSTQWRTLPPSGCSVDHVFCWVTLVSNGTVAKFAILTTLRIVTTSSNKLMPRRLNRLKRLNGILRQHFFVRNDRGFHLCAVRRNTDLVQYCTYCTIRWMDYKLWHRPKNNTFLSVVGHLTHHTSPSLWSFYFRPN